MPNRLLREGILSSRRVDALSPLAELFYRRLMSVVDDFGRYSADPTELRAKCYPLRIDSVRNKHISEWLAECVKASLVVVYAGKRGDYLEMLDFGQRVRAKQSKFDGPPSDDGLASDKCQTDDSQATGARQADARLARTPGRARAGVVDVDVGVVEDVDVDGDEKKAAAPPGVEPDVWKAWLRQKGKRQTADADRLQRKHLAEWRDQGFDVNAIVEHAVASHHAGLFPPKGGPPKRVNGHETAKERGLRNMDEITGVAGNGRRTIEGTAERVDSPAVPALSGGLR